jgi:S1-C subfamily serine protease
MLAALAATLLIPVHRGVAGSDDDGAVRVAPPPGAEDPLRRTAVVEAVESVSPAVVNIATDRVERRAVWSFPTIKELMSGHRRQRFRERITQSLGSGVCIDPAGYILTNSHVVARARTVHVKFGGAPEDEEGLIAKLVAHDPRNDLALLQVQGGPFPFVEMGTSHDLMIGEPAIAIGNPFGFSSTVTTGVISARDRTIELPTGPLDGAIQTDAAIDPGNSGGPLLNIRGQLIGINTAIFGQARGIGFSIPVDRVKAVLANLIDPVRSNVGWTGFEVANRGKHLVVDAVVPGSPAARAGLRVGDRIAGCESAEPCTVFEFKSEILRRGVGEKVTVRVDRGGENPAEIKVPVRPHPGLRLMRDRFGVEATPTEFQQEDGVTVIRFSVKSVLKDSPAERIQVQENDIIYSLGGVPLANAEDLMDVLGSVPGDQAVSVRVFRSTNRGWRWADTEFVLD